MAERRTPWQEGTGSRMPGDRPPAPDSPHSVYITTHGVRADRVRANQVTLVTYPPFHNYQQRRQTSDDVEDQALRDPRPIEDVSHNFTEDELDRNIEEKYLSYVANSSGADPNWRRLARKLQLDQATVDRLERENRDNVREFVYKMMLAWKRRHPHNKVRELIQVLCQSRLQAAAMALHSYFRSVHD